MSISDTTQDLLEFPCEIGIKAVGLDNSDFLATVVSIVQTQAPEVGLQSATTRSSSGGKYLSVTVTLMAKSRKQLDAIYQALSAHPDVVTAL